MDILQILSLLMALYGVYGMFTGEIYAKDGWSGRYIDKEEEPINFWSACICYIVMGLLLFFVAPT